MDELSRDLLHGTAGLRAAEDAMSGDLGGALANQALSEWAAQPQPVYQPVRPYRGRGSFFRFRVGLGVVCTVILLIMILIH